MFAMTFSMGILLGVLVGLVIVYLTFSRFTINNNRQLKKLRIYYRLLNQWLKNKQESISCTTYFHDNGYKTVAIYGMEILGQRLFDELQNTDCIVTCIIDKKINNINIAAKELLGIHPNDPIPDVDVIVVTASYFFYEIREQLKSKVNCDIVSIEDVVYWMDN